MISKSYSKKGTSCRVTFKMTPEAEEAKEVVLLGDFNSWSPEAHPLTLRKDGTFSTTVSLDSGSTYRFRYLVNGKVWENDEQADGYELNRFGSKDSVVEL